MTDAVKLNADAFLDALQDAIMAQLQDPDTSDRDRNSAIANGIKLMQIRHRIAPEDEIGYFDK